jgi:hypothetical protein
MFDCRKKLNIFFFVILAVAGPPILSVGYGKVHKYITQGRWDDYTYKEVISEDGSKKTIKIPIMIDDWREPSPWKVAPYIAIFILCPAISAIGIWKITRFPK